jgi:hypothetical protein
LRRQNDPRLRAGSEPGVVEESRLGGSEVRDGAKVARLAAPPNCYCSSGMSATLFSLPARDAGQFNLLARWKREQR